MHTTSETLLAQLQRADSAVAAWPRFVHLYGPLIYHWARRAGLQEQDAADVTQDVFVVLLGELPKFAYDRNKSFRSWLRAVTLNKWRDRARRRTVPIEPGADPDSLPDPADPLSAHDYRRYLIASALEQLRPEFRPETWAAFVRHGVDAAPASDVAKELGLTVGAVYAAKCRVLARLRIYLRGILD
jgi:RNA polymerase sigma-70 factor (ECF subfamily)